MARVLTPLAVSLVAILIAVCIQISESHDRLLETVAAKPAAEVVLRIRDAERLSIRVMENISGDIARDPRVASAWDARDHDGLFQSLEPTFQQMSRTLNLTHLYVHEPDGTNFIRVHAPARSGGPVGRWTMREAHRTGELAAGFESGRTGLLTLRTVVPWKRSGEIIGWIEIGKEFNAFAEDLGGPIATAIPKRSTDRETYERVSATRGVHADWEQLPDHVVPYSTSDRLTEILGSVLGRESDLISPAADDRTGVAAAASGVEIASVDGRTFAVSGTRFEGVEDDDAVLMFVMRDVTSVAAQLDRDELYTMAAFIGLCGAAFITAWYVLRRLQARLDAQRSSLIRSRDELREAEALAQAHLREAAALRRTVDEQSIVSVTDTAGRIIECNDMFSDISGYARDELIGRTHAVVNSGLHPKSFWVDMWRTVASGQAWRREVCNRAKDGSIYWVDTIIAPFVDADGRITKYVSIRTDITERKRAEERLRWSESQLIKAQQIGRIGSWSLDLTTKELEWSDMIYDIFEIDRERFGASYDAFLDAIHPDDREFVHAAYTASVASGEPYSVVHRLLMPDGRVKHVHERGETAYDEDGTPVRSLGTVQDVTDNKQTEYELQVAVREADAASRAKSEFLANMSHEIRTPMTAILGYTDLLCEDAGPDAGPERQRQTAQTIRRNGEHLLTIINDILDVSKIEAGQLRVERIDTSPAQIVEEVASLIAPRARDKGIELRVRYESPIPERICSDPTRLRQVLLNLVGNAVKFTESGSVTIAAGCDPAARRIRFSVVDTGIGMTPEQRDTIARFDAFTQADTSMTRRYGGTGLGLRISNALAEMLGGDIRIESAQGRGSTFTLTIGTGELGGVPMIDFDESTSRDVSREPEDEQPTVTGSERPLDGLQILLAEDGPDNQRLISFHLRRAGAQVRVCENGRIAAETIESAPEDQRPDLVLMDMQMPELDGYAATRRLRRGGFQGPILALTAHAMDGDREKCLDAGCDEYLTKPIDRHALVLACAEHASRKHRRPAA